MTTPGAQDAAAKERIIKHMNADHQDSIQRYLEYVENASFLSVRNARMTDIDLNGMKISYAGKQAFISFDPPMKSMRDARERLVQMDKDANEALGRDPIPITTFIPCYVHPAHLFNFTVCFLTYLFISRAANVQPGSLVYDHVLYKFPSFVNFVTAIRLWVFSIMTAIHVTESVVMAKKLRKHGLTPLDGVWWKWIGTCFIEGVTSFWRLDGHIEEKRREKEAKTH